MRLIDADYVKSKLNKSALGGHLHGYVCGVIDDAPTIDAKPVKHGRWIETNDDNKKRCSECDVIHLIAQYPHGNANYCPNCGAIMDLWKAKPHEQWVDDDSLSDEDMRPDNEVI